MRANTVLIVFAAIVLATLDLASAASGQTAPGWNRTVIAASAVPVAGSPGQYDLAVVWTVGLQEEQTAPLDLSTRVSVAVNGVVVATLDEAVHSDPGSGFCSDGGSSCGGSCGTGAVNGMEAALLCLPDGPCEPLCDCACRFPSLVSPFPGEPLRPGDEIMVILMPAPGALPEPDSSDDQLTLVFDGGPVLWNRGIESLTLSPTPGAPDSFFDVFVEGYVEFDGLQQLLPAGETADLSFELELQVNGVPHAVEAIDFQPLPLGASCNAGGCGSICGELGAAMLGCLISYSNPSICTCGGDWFSAFPGVPLLPGDVLTVILHPAPGALPELPSFPDDDQSEGQCCPTTGIGDARDGVAAAAAAMLHQNDPNPFNPTTSIGFSLADAGPVHLEVYDLAGRLVRTLVRGDSYQPGEWSVTWDGYGDSGARAASGVYLYRLTAGGRVETRKMTVLK